MGSAISLSLTMADDAAHRIVDVPMYFEEVNFHCYDKSLYYGTGAITEALMPVGAYASFRKGNLHDFFFKNATAGQNGKVVAVLTLKES